MWVWTQSKECQSDVKQAVNVDGLFVGSLIINSYSLFDPKGTNEKD